MSKERSRQRGFTLIELLIVIAICGFVTAVMAMMFNLVTKISSTSTAQNIVLSQVQQAGAWMSRDIMSADNVTLYTSGTRVCKIGRYQWNGTDNITSAIIDYDIINNRLLRTVEPGQAQIIAQFISAHGSGTDLVASTSPSENNTYIFTIQSVYGTSPAFSRVYKMNQRIP
jgi:prepilin-type N-terminal cleavage/methylation domain-containing protein